MTSDAERTAKRPAAWILALPLMLTRKALHLLRVPANRKWAPQTMYEPWLTDQTYQPLRAQAEMRSAFGPAELYMLYLVARDALNAAPGDAAIAPAEDAGVSLIVESVFGRAGRSVERVGDPAGEEQAVPIDHARRYALVHIADKTFHETQNHLARLYPRLQAGGLLLVSHYSSADHSEVSEALDAFFKDRPEVPLPVSSGQCLVIKRSVGDGPAASPPPFWPVARGH